MLAFATNSNVEKMMEFFRTFKRSSIADSAFRNWGVLATLRDQEEHEKIFSGFGTSPSLNIFHLPELAQHHRGPCGRAGVQQSRGSPRRW